jgi:hypothetical protein
MQMNRNPRWFHLVVLVLLAGVTSIIAPSCNRNSLEGMVVAVELSDSRGSYEGARIIAIDMDNPETEAGVLSTGFESAAAPAISHDGRYLYFQGKKEGDPAWQIWVTDLQKRRTSRVTELPDNCLFPASLPDGSVIFSRAGVIRDKVVYDLYRCQMDGTALTRITFDPSINIHASVLQEGRVLYNSSQQYPETRTTSLRVMLPDGTKSEAYYQGDNYTAPLTGGSESTQGYVYFVEAGGELCRVKHTRPLHTLEYLTWGFPGTFSSVYPMETGKLLVSYRPSVYEPFALYSFDAGTKDAPLLLYKGAGNILDPVLVKRMVERPRILPSAVDPANPVALLMSQDINHSMFPVNKGISGDSMASRIRLSSLEGELGVVEVKADGSFYVKLDADTPFRIEAVNSQGEVVRGPSGWIYLRANERRACVGCHADPELAPENVQPLAVKEDPVLLVSMIRESGN